MVIQFETTDLRSLCEDELLATQTFGHHARLLLAGLADLVSAPTLGELPPGIAEPMEGNGTTYCIEVGSFRLIFAPNHKTLPIDEGGALEACKVTRVKVLAIERHA